jgi:hypothetical protein
MRNWFGLAAILAVTLTLGACNAQQAHNVNEEVRWSRFDCTTNDVAFEQAKAICMNRANAAGIAGTANMPSSGGGLGGAIADGIVQGITQAQITQSTALSCMAEQGYTRRTISEQIAACPKSQTARTARRIAAK